MALCPCPLKKTPKTRDHDRTGPSSSNTHPDLPLPRAAEPESESWPSPAPAERRGDPATHAAKNPAGRYARCAGHRRNSRPSRCSLSRTGTGTRGALALAGPLSRYPGAAALQRRRRKCSEPAQADALVPKPFATRGSVSREAAQT